MSAGPPSARQIAAGVIERVERDRAFAAAALDAELQRYPQLAERERALATELVYGTLRLREQLLAELGRHAARGLGKDRLVRAHLLVAAYQLTRLDRVPSFAAVDAAVDAVKRARGPRVAGFVNALLRKLGASGARLSDRPAAATWLTERLEAAVGAEEARALLAGEAPHALRVVGGDPPPAWLADAEPARWAPAARVVHGGGDLRRREGYGEGRFVIQEEGAQLVAWALGARPGERVLDACAGRGQKTSLLVEQVGESGEVWAADLHPAKLQALRAELERLHLPLPNTAAVDWTTGPGAVPEGFDRALIDAPCSGVGTLRRRPEIALRLGPEDVARLAALQTAIVRRVAERVRPGGRVVYAVCSVLPEEAEAVIEACRDVLEPAAFDAPVLAGLVEPAASAVRLLPAAHGTDGYFVASLRRRA